MGKICPTCGTNLREDAAVCFVCDTPVATVPREKTPSPVRKKDVIKAAIIATCVVALIGVITIFLFNMPKPQQALDNYFAVRNGDLSKIEQMAPAQYWEHQVSSGVYGIEELKALCNQSIANRKLQYGDYKVSGKILSETYLDDKTVGNIRFALADYKVVNNITAAKTLTVEVRIEGTKDSSTTTETFTAVKIDGAWYLINFTIVLGRPYAAFVLY